MTTFFYNTTTDDDTQITVSNNLISPQDRSISVRAGSSVTSIQGGESREVDAYSSVNTAQIDPSQGLQARTPTGSPRQGTLMPTDIVTVGGTETTVQNAAALGLIEQMPNGRWVIVPDGAARALASEQTHEEPVDDAQALPNASVEASLTDLCSTIPGTSQVAVLQQLVSNGEILPGTLARAASEGGIEPSVLNDRISTVVESFQQQAETMLKGLGADDPSQFWAWAQEHHKDDLKKAMSQHGMERTTKGYAPLFSAYVETLADHSPEDILNASFGSGIKAQMVDRQVVLDIPGHGRLTYRSAVKAGLIRVSGI